MTRASVPRGTPKRDDGAEAKKKERFGILPGWMTRLKLAGTDWRILLAIACCADATTREAYPGIDRLAEMVGVRVKEASRSTSRLRKEGALKIRRQGRINFYTVVFDDPREASQEPSIVRKSADNAAEELSADPRPDSPQICGEIVRKSADPYKNRPKNRPKRTEKSLAPLAEIGCQGDLFGGSTNTNRGNNTDVGTTTTTDLGNTVADLANNTDAGTAGTEAPTAATTAVGEVADPFDRLWNIYPRKVAKAAALKAWKKAIKDTDPEVIIAGATRYARERKDQDQNYTAHPATWLSGRRWEDAAPASGEQSDGDAAKADPGFERFWDFYPRKVDKAAAFKAWKGAIKDTDPEKIIIGATSYAQQRRGEDPDYTEKPANWLNKRRWEDMPAPRDEPPWAATVPGYVPQPW
jgi:hypothetical protein